jgi:hypothetical protein
MVCGAFHQLDLGGSQHTLTDPVRDSLLQDPKSRVSKRLATHGQTKHADHPRRGSRRWSSEPAPPERVQIYRHRRHLRHFLEGTAA